MTRLLGVDLGTERIGLAVGDTVTGSVIAADDDPARRRSSATRAPSSTPGARAAHRRAGRRPAAEHGWQRGRAGSSRHATWAIAVAAQTSLPLSWRDERLTTEDAIDRIGPPARGKSGGPPSAEARRAYRARLDREAAAAIVQAEINARRAMAETGSVQVEP